MIATASAIKFAGGIPVPVEVGNDLLIDYQSIEKTYLNKTKAIMPTHLNGRTCNMDIILEIAGENELLIFEDAAQALGSMYKEVLGTFGEAAFYPAKTLGALVMLGLFLQIMKFYTKK